jgi:hypothetical protein
MSENDDDARLDEEVKHLAAVSNSVIAAMAAAKNFDPLQIARGLLVVSRALVNEDPASRVMLAKEMIKTALEIDPDLRSARYQ